MTQPDSDPRPQTHQSTAHDPAAATPAPSTRRMVKSSDLLAGRKELLIEHNGGVYSLRETSKGKLILTK
jgi:hemin uptake protein HemP